MKKHLMSIVLACFMVIGLASIVSGCKDDGCPVNPTETAAIIDQDVFDIDATYAKVFSGNGDVIAQDDPRGGGPGKRDTVRGGGRDTVKRDTTSRPMPWQSVLPCLKLTPEQNAKLREFMMAQRDCEKAARDQFRTALEPLRRAQKAAMDAIRADLKAGTITREEANAKVKALNERMKNATQEAEAQVRAAVKACMDTFFTNLESILSPEQLALWNEWKRTGKTPCQRNPIGVRP
ncbi:MAG: Spy/CpxP family protein refolding chaperone [Candidatus Kapaibacteriota bacterium]